MRDAWYVRCEHEEKANIIVMDELGRRFADLEEKLGHKISSEVGSVQEGVERLRTEILKLGGLPKVADDPVLAGALRELETTATTVSGLVTSSQLYHTGSMQFRNPSCPNCCSTDIDWSTTWRYGEAPPYPPQSSYSCRKCGHKWTEVG